jgi:molybdate transport system substrate-binding protein
MRANLRGKTIASPWQATCVLLLVLTAATTACGGASGTASPTLLVGVAASLEPLFRELTPAFEADAGVDVTLVVGSSGALAQQIRQGAPLDAFASADLGHARSLLAGESLVLDGRFSTFAEGRLAVVTGLATATNLAWTDIVTDSRVRHLAIANPELSPYGERARAALGAVGLWAEAKPRMVFGESVSQVLAFAQSDSAEVAFVALSHVRAGLAGELSAYPVDPCLHDGLNQVIVGVSSTEHPQLVRRLIDFVGSDRAHPTLERLGYADGHGRLGRPECGKGSSAPTQGAP